MNLRKLFGRTLTVLTSAVLAAILTTTSAISLNAAAAPVDGGKTVFTAADFKLDYDSVKGNGAFKAYRIDMSVEKMDGKDVVKMTAQKEDKQGLIDFSYYQYNNSEYLPALNTKDYHFLKIKYKRAAATTADFTFLKATEDALGKAGTSTNCSFKADSTDWSTIIIDLSAESSLKWTDKNIRQFRLYPWGMKNASEFAGQTIYIEYVGFFKTEADAKAYGEATAKDTTSGTAAQKVDTAAKTADPIALAVITAALAMFAGAVIMKRRRVR